MNSAVPSQQAIDLVGRVQEDALFKQFLGDDFDVRIHASQILQGVAVSQQLAKLAEGINVLDKELQQHVSSHYEDLLSQATGIEKLEGVLSMMQTHIQCLLSAVERLRSKIVEPYNKIYSQTLMLARLQSACEMLRRIIRILYLSKRLQAQLAGGLTEITKAAQSLHELDQLSKDVDFSGVEVVEEDQRLTRQRRAEVEKQAEQMLFRGLESQNQTQVGTALQVFYNLDCLEATMDKTLSKLKSSVHQSVRDSIDVQKLSQPATESSDRSSRGAPGRAVMPTPGNTPSFRAILWANLERLTEHVYSSSAQLHLLQRVLAKKRDPHTHQSFVSVVGGEEGSSVDLLRRFWDGVAEVLTQEFQRAAEESTYIRQAFEVEYPKFLRLYSELWKKLQQLNTSIPKVSGDIKNEEDPDTLDETVRLESEMNLKLEMSLRSTLAPFENAYLSRSLSRLFDPVNLMFSGSETLPPKEEVDVIIKTISSELSVSLVDPVLCQHVAKNVAKTIQLFCAKCEQLIITDGEASQVIGPPTEGQLLNAGTINLLYDFEKQIQKAVANVTALPLEAAKCIIEAMKIVPSLMKNALQPLLMSVADAIEAIILTMHNENFSGPAKSEANSGKLDAPCSLYMRELQGFIARVASDYLSLFNCQEMVAESVHPLACRCLELFVRHTSLIRPLGEGGKMRLAADFAQMEMAVTPFCQRAGELGKPYRVLRAFRPLLFQTPDHLALSSAIGGLIPYSLILHFLFGKAPPEFKSPHQSAGWSISRYSQWLDEHRSERERLSLIKGTLEAYVKGVKQRQGKEFAAVYPVMLQLLQKGLES